MIDSIRTILPINFQLIRLSINRFHSKDIMVDSIQSILPIHKSIASNWFHSTIIPNCISIQSIYLDNDFIRQGFQPNWSNPLSRFDPSYRSVCWSARMISSISSIQSILPISLPSSNYQYTPHHQPLELIIYNTKNLSKIVCVSAKGMEGGEKEWRMKLLWSLQEIVQKSSRNPRIFESPFWIPWRTVSWFRWNFTLNLFKMK